MVLKTIIEETQQKARKLGVNVDFKREDIIDERHLNCLWYYNRLAVAAISKRVNSHLYELVIVPSGEIYIYGRINGEEVSFKNRKVKDLITDYDFDDEKLTQCLNSKDENNFLKYSMNNWFGAHFFINDECVSSYSEVLDDNLLINLQDLEGLVDLLENFIKKINK